MKLQILRLLVGLAVLGVLLAVIWVLGGLLEPKESESRITMAVMLGATLLFLLAVGLVYLKSLRGAASIESSLRAGALAQFAGARPDKQGEVDELRKQFETALDALRRSKRGKTALHSLPLYVLVGPPGSGKTTMLRESGIEFPFMAGRREIRGVGGTRNCDWWFGARGIMLDTAGRYMVEQDDREEWLAFLSMIRKARGRRAIDGAVVAISLGEILAASETELRSHAEMVRERVDELTQQLGVVFPVYLVFTKCDQLAGFVEFFERLTKEERKQVWGFSVPLGSGSGAAAAFPEEFDALYRMLARRRLQDFTAERGRKKKEKSYSFPLQFSLIKQRITDFLGLLGQANPYQEASPLRGVYFTSGTQEGTVISQLQRTIYEAAEMAIDIPPDQRKTYFIDSLFETVVFGDAGLAQPTAATRRRLRLMRYGGVAAAALFGLTLAYHSFANFFEHRSARLGHTAAIKALADARGERWRGTDPATRTVSKAFLGTLQGLWERLPESKDLAIDADDEAAASVRSAFYDGLRLSFVTGCVERAIAGARTCPVVKLSESDAAQLDYFPIKQEYDGFRGAVREWEQVFMALISATAPLDGAAAQERLVKAWDDCVVEADRDAYRDKQARWRAAFIGARATASRLVAIERAADFPRTDVDACVRTMAENLGLLWRTFSRRGIAEQLPVLAKKLTEVVGLADLQVDPGPFAAPGPSLARFYTEPGIERALGLDMAELRTQFLTNTPAESEEYKQRKRVLDEIEVQGKAELRRRRATAWAEFLSALEPNPIAEWNGAEPWTKVDAARPQTVTEQLARAIERAFDIGGGAEAAATKFESKLRGGANLEEAQARFGVAVADVGGLHEAMQEYRGRVSALRPRLKTAWRAEIDSVVQDAFATLEGKALNALERLASSQLIVALENAWALVTKELDKVRLKYPFDVTGTDAEAVNAETFQRIFSAGSPYETLDKIVTLGTAKLSDGNATLPLTPEVLRLHKQLKALRRAFIKEDGSFGARLVAKPFYTSGITSFAIKLLGVTLDMNVDQSEFGTYEWKPSDSVAEIGVSADSSARRLTIRDLKDDAPGVDSYRGVWGLLRLFQKAEYQSARGRFRWSLGSGAVAVGLDVADSPLRDVLIEEGAFRLTPPTSLFQ